MKPTFCIFFFLLCLLGKAQQQSFQGYVINLAGDTEKVEVKVNPKKTLEQFQRVSYKMANGLQKVSKPDKIKGYGYEGHHYIAGENDGDKVFYKVLSSGNLSLCEISYEVLLMNEFRIKNERFFKKSGSDDFVHLKHNKIKKQLKEQMSDNNDLVKEIESKEEITDDNVVEVFNQYNTWAKSHKG